MHSSNKITEHSYWLRRSKIENKMAEGTVTLTEDQFERLLSRLGNANIAQPQGSFASCSSRYNGVKDSDVRAFIDAVETFKQCANVSDENALRGLSMLLDGFAATWWQGVKDTATSWSDAIELLRITFGPKKPAYKVFRELFASEQDLKTNSDVFICRARALLAQLPSDTLSVDVQIDMVYGLLNRRIREKVPRDGVRSFNDLLRECRRMEETFMERFENKNDTKTSPSTESPKPRLKCSFCGYPGHSEDLCRRKQSAMSASSGTKPDNRLVSSPAVSPVLSQTKGLQSNSQISCYGCKRPGYIKSNCPSCSTATNSLDFCSLDRLEVPTISPKPRPMLEINILGLNGTGIVDTAAKQSVASSTLYEALKAKGVQFVSSPTSIKLADGTVRDLDAAVATVNVLLQDHCIPTTFIALPNADKTLLGIDFLTSAGLNLEIGQLSWSFTDRPQVKYPLSFEAVSNTAVNTLEVLALNLLRSDEGSMLSTDQKELLCELIATNQDIFALGGESTPFAEHQIDTGTHPPTSVPPYRMTPANKEKLRVELDKLIQDGAVEECDSAWSAPVVLVPKKDGGTRLCVDYRALNSVTTPVSYPLPRMDDLLHSTKKTVYMTTLDLRAGYHQVQVRKEDRDKTSFVTPFGTFRYRVMPFGLRNAPATFQKLIDRFRSGLPNALVLAYLDDIFILSETFDTHLDDLKCVFERLRLFKLRANRDKCTFASARVKYLGHIVTSEGIHVDGEKTAAITNMLPPRNVKQVQSFIQSCSWYRRFIANFADVSRPLTNLLKKNVTWDWGPTEQDAFDQLKLALTTTPVLQQNDGTKPYTLRTDASAYALGAVLLQTHDDQEHPIEFASRLLTSAERNYSTTEREALAVVWSLSKFRGYLDSSSVIVATDHQPLKWLLSLKTPTGRLARWALMIQSYNIKFVYVPGKQNHLPDMLSRPVCDHDVASTCDICYVSIDVPKRSADDIRTEQLKDPDVRKIIESFEETTNDDYAKWTARGYIMTGGVLYRYPDLTDSEEAVLVVPCHERKRVLHQHHDLPTAGHYGAERTLQKIARLYYFTGMRQYIQDYVKDCPECQRYKASNQKPAGLVQTPVVNQRFEVLAIDLFGPLPKNDAGEQWVFIVEDTASKWVELFPLISATAEECAKTLINEIFLRYGCPRRIISDNGVQFVSQVMQQACYYLGIKQNLTPLFHPQANMVERKNRDLKPRLAILVGADHTTWSDKLPAVRFAMNSAKCSTTNYTPSYVTFAREIRSPDEVGHDLRTITNHSENFLPEITPYLHMITTVLQEARETHDKEQDRQKKYADQSRRPTVEYMPGDKVLVALHTKSSAAKGVTSKFDPKRDGPYVVLRKVSKTTYEVADLQNRKVPLGVYHTSNLKAYTGADDVEPVVPIRKRGRPRKIPTTPVAGSSTTQSRNQRGSL